MQVFSGVIFHGTKAKQEVVECMRQCDFLVSPSLFETFGVVIIETLACGKPVIATRSGGPEEILNKETGILVPQKDIDALANAIDYMLSHHGEYSSEKIARYAHEKFSFQAVGHALDEIYRGLL